MTIRNSSSDTVSFEATDTPTLPLPLSNAPETAPETAAKQRRARIGTRCAKGVPAPMGGQQSVPVPTAGAPATPAMAAPTIGARDVQRWERVRAKLTAKLGPDSFSSWFGRCRLEALDKNQATLSVPTTFLKTWIRTHYGTLLLDLWQEQAGEIVRVDVIVRSALRGSAPAGADAGPHSAAGKGGSGSFGHDASNATRNRQAFQAVSPAGTAADGSGARAHHSSVRNATGGVGAAPSMGGQGLSGQGLSGQGMGAPSMGALGRFGSGFSGSPLDPAFTFANFVEGSSNHMACSAARAVAEADGAAARFNPLFIHANVGLGKTHLLQAIAWGAKERNAGVRTLYLTAEYFMWRFASAIRDQSALSFKESLRDIDLLLIDDMQFLQGKSIQQEFCHLLNALIDSAKQVVVAADREPGMLESLDERVKSRLRGGVALEIKSPELAMRESMLELRYREAQREDPSLDIPQDVLHYVAGKVAASGRDVEGAFNQLLIQHRFSDGVLTVEQIERMLGHLVQSGESRKVRVEDIQKVVARHYEVSRTDLLSNRRTRVIVRPRQIAMYLAKTLTLRSLPEIGRRFGGRDHTTVLHAVRKIESLLGEDPKLAQEIELLKRLIEEQGA